MPTYVNVFKTELIYPKLAIIYIFLQPTILRYSFIRSSFAQHFNDCWKAIVKEVYLLIVNQGCLKQQK